MFNPLLRKLLSTQAKQKEKSSVSWACSDLAFCSRSLQKDPDTASKPIILQKGQELDQGCPPNPISRDSTKVLKDFVTTDLLYVEFLLLA